MRKQCELLSINRSTLYYKSRRQPFPRKDELCELLVKLHDDHPYYGRRRLHQMALKNGFAVTQYQVKTLMKELKIVALVPSRNLTRANKQHRKYPYLLKGLKI